MHEASALGRQPATLITVLLHALIVTAEIVGEPPLPALLPAEKEALGRVCLMRQLDFTKGRACARRALLGFGVEATPVLI
jgi:4'-phosphopantetheinyl transferase EntD